MKKPPLTSHLKKLGLNDKEQKIYLALLEFGNQPASLIAKKLNIPRATTLFILNRLHKKQYIRKSHKNKTQYYYADPSDLEKTVNSEISNKQKALQNTIPLLKELKNPFTSPPKISFFEGIEGCRKAYRTILDCQSKEAYEFGTHTDLEKMGQDFMAQFIKERSAKKIFLHDICQDNPIHQQFLKLDKKQHRKQTLFPKKIGEIYSSICIFDNKVLLLNLYQDAFAILIENKQVAETLKTIHKLSTLNLKP